MFPFLLQNACDCIYTLLKTSFQTGFCLPLPISLIRKISGKAAFERYVCYCSQRAFSTSNLLQGFYDILFQTIPRVPDIISDRAIIICWGTIDFGLYICNFCIQYGNGFGGCHASGFVRMSYSIAISPAINLGSRVSRRAESFLFSILWAIIESKRGVKILSKYSNIGFSGTFTSEDSKSHRLICPIVTALSFAMRINLSK